MSDDSDDTVALSFDPAQVEVWRHLLASVAEEMGVALERTAYSPNIKERFDHSCALFDAEGRLLAQAAHIPVHLGAMPLMLATLRAHVPWHPGDMWLCNDPRYGGTHLPDLTLVAPVFHDGELLGFVASRAHHADIGGMAPGSLPLSTELCQEGLILPPVRLVCAGQVQEDIVQILCANSRTPAERRGDLAAQVAANETGTRRLRALVERYGRDEFRRRTVENIAYAAEAVRRALHALPEGVYAARDFLDDDGLDARDILIAVTVTVDGGMKRRITFDFTGSAPQVRGPLNATEAITRSACYYVVRCLVPQEVPTNAGCFEPITVVAPEGTVVNARFPAAVAGGNVETSQRIVDVVLRALALAAPDRVPAASQGTMNNVTIGGYDPVHRRSFAYYETLGGGAGGAPAGDGAHAIHTHMTNTRNTPVETLESHYPLRVRAYRIADGTGGAGVHRGGDGLVREIELLVPCTISLLTERRRHPPYGLNAAPGAPGKQWLTWPDGTRQDLPGKWSGYCPAHTVLTVQTPGGGGWSPVMQADSVDAAAETGETEECPAR
ncbi:MAG: hydantoinase B/oxoprolinase family protein [Chloroherpetonaceae bacterium]|nr:hydantoinase B/oxoprolinase family protein [Chthonomonadaceae bacterium]MDW8208964.1 hydantoinase B/oxoprolinase family protein [Chloroherpetonaceae bacterium]